MIMKNIRSGTKCIRGLQCPQLNSCRFKAQQIVSSVDTALAPPPCDLCYVLYTTCVTHQAAGLICHERFNTNIHKVTINYISQNASRPMKRQQTATRLKCFYNTTGFSDHLRISRRRRIDAEGRLFNEK